MDWYLYNSTDKDIQMPVFKMTLKKRATVNLRQSIPNVSDSFVMNEIENGSLFDLVLSKQVFVSNIDNRKTIVLNPYNVTKPFTRRGLATKLEKAEASKFIEELQSAFDGKVLHQQPEDIISKNTASLLSASSFNGVQNILDEDELDSSIDD